MKTPFSRSHRHETKLQSILSEASRLFNLQGSRATTLLEIATSMGLTKTSLYYYASNKDELIYRCYLSSCDAGDDMMAEAQRDSQTGLACLLSFVRIFFERRTEIDTGLRPHIAMLTEVPTLSPAHRLEIEGRMTRHFGTLLGFVQRGIKDGSVNPCAPIPTVLALGAIVNWSYVWLGRFEPNRREVVVGQLLDLIQHGISATPYVFGDVKFPELGVSLQDGFDRDEQNDIKRHAFMRVGTQMFNQRGYVGTSLDEMAKQLDVTKGAFYYHIRDKEDLLVQCFRYTLDLEERMLAKAKASANAQAGGPIEAIELFLRYLFNVQHSDQGPLLAFRALPSLDAVHRREVFDLTQSLSDRLGAVIQAGIDNGTIRDIHPDIVENVIAGTVDAAPELALRMPFQKNAKASAEYLGLIFNGIAAR